MIALPHPHKVVTIERTNVGVCVRVVTQERRGFMREDREEKPRARIAKKWFLHRGPPHRQLGRHTGTCWHGEHTG